MQNWNPWVTYGWLVFFATFLGLDLAAKLSHNPRIPTFSRVLAGMVPAWIVIPAAVILLVHMIKMYWR